MAELPLPVRFLAAWIGTWVARHQERSIAYLKEENRVLMKKLGGRVRLADPDRRRLGSLGRDLGRKALHEIAGIAAPDTILRWYRELVARKYDGSGKRKPGRPRKASEVVRLLVRMAKENPRWGYTRLRGALRNVGHEIGRNTIKRILSEQGIDPAPSRSKRYPWATFIKAHLGAIAATDFLTAEVLTFHGLVRFYVLFVIDVATRRVEIAGITTNPNGAWMQQVARNLVDSEEAFLMGKRYLIMDRDPLYTAEFRRVVEAAGVKAVRLPPRRPNLNAFAERFVLSIKSECLDRIVPMGEGHLRKAVAQFVAHYHRERNHQGVGNQLLLAGPVAANGNGRVRRRERMGGLLSFYYREAA
jgi:putative transposase